MAAKTRKILLIVVDQWRGDHLGCLGHPCVATPNLDRLAREGTLFARHYAQSTPCGPSRASILSGQYVMNHRVATNWTPTSASLPTLPKLLRAAGVAPHLIGYTTSIPDPRVTPHEDPRFRHWSIAEGWDVVRPFEAERGAYLRHLAEQGYPARDSYEAQFADADTDPAALATSPIAAADHDTAWLAEAGAHFLAQPPAGDWLLHLGFFRPHPPLAAPAPFLADYADCTPPAAAAAEESGLHPYMRALRAGVRATTAHPALPGLAAEIAPAQVAELRRAYYALCSEVDAQIGRILGLLEARGELEETLVVFTGDHGEHLGDQGLFGKRGPRRQRLPRAADRAGAGAAGGAAGRQLHRIGGSAADPAGVAGRTGAAARRRPLAAALPARRDAAGLARLRGLRAGLPRYPGRRGAARPAAGAGELRRPARHRLCLPAFRRSASGPLRSARGPAGNP